jgi:hypothetical protein
LFNIEIEHLKVKEINTNLSRKKVIFKLWEEKQMEDLDVDMRVT